MTVARKRIIDLEREIAELKKTRSNQAARIADLERWKALHNDCGTEQCNVTPDLHFMYKPPAEPSCPDHAGDIPTPAHKICRRCGQPLKKVSKWAVIDVPLKKAFKSLSDWVKQWQMRDGRYCKMLDGIELCDPANEDAPSVCFNELVKIAEYADGLEAKPSISSERRDHLRKKYHPSCSHFYISLHGDKVDYSDFKEAVAVINEILDAVEGK